MGGITTGWMVLLFGLNVGSTQLLAQGSALGGRPRIQSAALAGSTLVVSGENGFQGNSYYVLSTTNVAAPLADWTRVATNFMGSGGTFSFTNSLRRITPERFYAVQVIPSSPCLASLDALGIHWTWGPESPGVTTPVTVKLPLAEMPFRELDGNLRETWFMDCELALALHRMVQVLAARGVVEVVDLGIYSYRCIGGGTPPDCPLGLSMHAKALAVDIAALVTRDMGVLSVEDDWVIDLDGRTCFARARGPEDAFLHAVLCDIYAAGIFTIHLTPNYNADHRNHWHLDLTPNSARFIR
jgi:hypothetical protein